MKLRSPSTGGGVMFTVKGDELIRSAKLRSKKLRVRLTPEYSAEAESDGTVVAGRVTATRLATTGVLAFGMKKGRQDTRTLHLTIKGPDGYYESLSLDPALTRAAHEFVHRFNAYVAKLPADGIELPSETPDEPAVS